MDTARKITVEVPLETSLKRRSEPAVPVSPRPSYWVTAGCRLADLRSSTQTPRQGSLVALGDRAEGRPVIAADTSTWVAFLEGNSGEDVQLLDRALEDRHVVMVPVVLTELLSGRELPQM